MKRPVVYIAGPMRGYKHFNFPTFDEAQVRLEAAGFEVINPAEMDRQCGEDPYTYPDDFDWAGSTLTTCTVREVFLRDTSVICRDADAIYLLPGWEDSKGAQAELALAKALGLFVIPHSLN